MNRTPYRPKSLGTLDPVILNSSIRYGVSRDCSAQDARGNPVKVAIVVIERENGTFESLAIPESKIRFAGEGVIEQEVKRVMGL